MERKTVHAILLSLAVVAGGMMMTNNAYAQTNTERLTTVVDNTNSIVSTLDMIFSTIQDGFASVMASLGMVESDISEINSHLQHIDSDLEAIHGDLTSLAAIDEDLHMIHDDLAAIDTDLHMIHEDLTTLHNDLDAIGASVAQSTTGIAPLSEAIQANSAAINTLSDKLDMISEAVGAVQETVEMPPEDEVSEGDGWHADKDSFDVLVSAFGDNKADDKDYTSELVFSCESNVWLGDVKADNVGDGSNTSTPDSAGIVFKTYDTPGDNARSTITADDRTVFDSHFQSVANAPVSYTAGASFGLQPLSAGSNLVIEVSTANTGINVGDDSTVGTDNDHFTIKEYLEAENRGLALVANVTNGDVASLSKSNAGKKTVLTLDINWYSTVSDAKCTLTPPTGPSISYDKEGEEVSTVLTVVEGSTGTIRYITDKDIKCSDSTSITSVSVEGVLEGFHSFISLMLTADTEKPLKFDEKFVATLDEPLEFNGGNVTFSGRIPSDAVVATIHYDTVTNGACSNP